MASKKSWEAFLDSACAGNSAMMQWLLFDPLAPQSEEFFEYICDTKYDWLRKCLALASALKQKSPTRQEDAFRKVLN